MPLDEKNDWASPGARASLRMNLRDADMAPEQELNEILWQSVQRRRTGFIRPLNDYDDAKNNFDDAKKTSESSKD